MSNEPPEPPNPDRTIIRSGRQSTPGRGGPAAGPPAQFPPQFPPAPAPAPGGYETASTPYPDPSPGPAAGVELRFADGEPELLGPEPLVAAASRLIRLGGQLRTMPMAPDLQHLRQLVIRERGAFAARTQRLGIDSGTTQLADYILCAFIDDSVMTTPWGNGSAWSRPSLLAAYHGDTRGGEILFNVAQKMEIDPRAEPRVVELLYQCLSLGFEGRMALVPQGPQMLSHHREGLYESLGRTRRPGGADLSPQSRGKAVAIGVRAPLVPLWVALGGIALLALILFTLLYLRLAADSDAAIRRLQDAVGTSIPAPAAPPATPAAGFDRMRSILQPDIDSGRVKLIPAGGDVIIRLISKSGDGEGTFRPGTADLAGDLSDTIGRIAEAAKVAGGTVRISGHTDNQPVKPTLAYPSNQALSEARAKSVEEALETAGVDASKLSSTGYADSQAIASNATLEGRQENRRVEIRVASNAAWE